jgi:hypothetical protein
MSQGSDSHPRSRTGFQPGRLRVAAHNLREPMAVRPRVWGNPRSIDEVNQGRNTLAPMCCDRTTCNRTGKLEHERCTY